VIVIDASVLTDYLVGRAEAVEALAATFHPAPAQPLHAPEVVEPETLHALRRLVMTGRITEERAGDAVADLGAARLIRYRHAPLRARAWELRHDLTAYDALYLALAEGLEEPLLLTADRGLAARGRRSLGEDAIVLVR
jgi:predicted nucleic acid-binding protein